MAARASVVGEASVTAAGGDARGTATGATAAVATAAATRAGRPFDVILSRLAIHHLSDDRERAVCAEAAGKLLAPGETFIYLKLVASPTGALHAAFLAALSMAENDPSDALAPPDDQLRMLRDARLTDVECSWQWREMAVLAGRSRAGGEV